MDFKGKAVIITRGSSRIGRGAVLYFSELDAQLNLFGRYEKKNLKETASQCKSDTFSVVADVTKENEDLPKIQNFSNNFFYTEEDLSEFYFIFDAS